MTFTFTITAADRDDSAAAAVPLNDALPPRPPAPTEQGASHARRALPPAGPLTGAERAAFFAALRRKADSVIAAAR